MSGPRLTPRRSSVLWVVGVVAIGLGLGLLLALATPAPHGPGGPGPRPIADPAALAAIVLSGLDLALLAALIFVYLRTFLETRARFAFGLVLVLVTLLVQILASSPAVFGAFGLGPGGLVNWLLLSSLFEAIALTVFLGLSLE
ncbi:MAG TPA: hypothetical protein VEL82_07000 [Thermoplasmata archaeon]|nr:hypothetical protein [Thermoplasmata archaeon]